MARIHGYSKVMTGDSCTRLAIKLMTNLALGRGAFLAWDTVHGLGASPSLPFGCLHLKASVGPGAPHGGGAWDLLQLGHGGVGS